VTDTYDLQTRGRSGVIVAIDVTAIGNGQSFVTGAPVVLPLVVVAATNDQFEFNEVEYIVAPGSYATLAALATAVTARRRTKTLAVPPPSLRSRS